MTRRLGLVDHYVTPIYIIWPRPRPHQNQIQSEEAGPVSQSLGSVEQYVVVHICSLLGAIPAGLHCSHYWSIG